MVLYRSPNATVRCSPVMLSRTSGIKREAVGFKYSPPAGEAATRPNTHPPTPPTEPWFPWKYRNRVRQQCLRPDVRHKKISPLLHTTGFDKRRSILICLFEFGLMVEIV